MARVVQRRKAPPYALIVFVFLFLVASILAAYLHIERDKAQKVRQEAELRNEKLLSLRELKDPRIKELIRKYDDKTEAGTVVGQLVIQVNELTKKINGVVTTPEDAIAKTDALCKEKNSYGGLIDMVRSADDQRNATEKEANDFKKQRNDALDERDKARSSHDETISQYKEWKDRSNADIESLKKKLGEMTAEHAKLLAEAKAAWDHIRQDKDRKIGELTDRNQAGDTKMRELQQMIAVLQKKIGNMRARSEVITKADGKIRSLAEGGFCFIDLGAEDGVEAGFTFAVYPQTGIPKGGANKGSIAVVSVGRDVSRCRVVSQDRANPIIPDDLVANVAFDSIRKWRFVVEGNFDLHGTGRPTPQGAVKAKLLLKRLGAVVADKVNIEVDFVIMGAKPPVPRRPDEDAPPQDWEIWRQKVKEQKRFAQIEDLAKKLGIPIRNTNWLLDMTGYMPIKALRDVARP